MQTGAGYTTRAIETGPRVSRRASVFPPTALTEAEACASGDARSRFGGESYRFAALNVSHWAGSPVS